MSTDIHQRDRVLLRTSQDGMIGGGGKCAPPGEPEDLSNAETVETQVGMLHIFFKKGSIYHLATIGIPISS